MTYVNHWGSHYTVEGMLHGRKTRREGDVWGRKWVTSRMLLALVATCNANENRLENVDA